MECWAEGSIGLLEGFKNIIYNKDVNDIREWGKAGSHALFRGVKITKRNSLDPNDDKNPE